MENFSFAKTHQFSAGNIKIMPIWPPAWKTLVNSASSSSGKQTKGCLLAVLPRKVTSLHPCPWLSATLPCTPGTQPLYSAVAVKGSRSRFRWPWDVHSRDPKAHQGTGTSCSHMRQDQFCWYSCPVAKEQSYFTSSQMPRPPFIYFFTVFYKFTSAKVSILLTYLCLLSKIFFIGNNFHFQASSRLETQNYLSKSDNENITHVQRIKSHNHSHAMEFLKGKKISVLWA